jgi:hypothetical protein
MIGAAGPNQLGGPCAFMFAASSIEESQYPLARHSESAIQLLVAAEFSVIPSGSEESTVSLVGEQIPRCARNDKLTAE